MLYRGIDLHRRSIVVCTLDQVGSVVDRRQPRSDPPRSGAFGKGSLGEGPLPRPKGFLRKGVLRTWRWLNASRSNHRSSYER